MSEMPNYHISENAAAGIGICVLIVLIAIAVTIFILCGMKTKKYEFMEKDRDGSSINNTFRADITLLLSSGLSGRTEDLRAGC